MCFRTSSSSESFPRDASRASANPVNCFDEEPMFVGVSGVNGIPYVRSAAPYAFTNDSLPPLITPTTAPGVSLYNCAAAWSTLPSGVVATGSERVSCTRTAPPLPAVAGVTSITYRPAVSVANANVSGPPRPTRAARCTRLPAGPVIVTVASTPS